MLNLWLNYLNCALWQNPFYYQARPHYRLLSTNCLKRSKCNDPRYVILHLFLSKMTFLGIKITRKFSWTFRRSIRGTLARRQILSMLANWDTARGKSLKFKTSSKCRHPRCQRTRLCSKCVSFFTNFRSKTTLGFRLLEWCLGHAWGFR